MELTGSLLCPQEPANGFYLNHLNVVCALTPYISNTFLILSHLLCLDLVSGHFPSGLSTTNLYALLISPIRVSCSVYLTRLEE